MHTHHWRTTSKVFALVCECGTIYHDWLLAEVDRLKAVSTASGPSEEVITLRAQLEEARSEAVKLRGELDETKRELEERAAQVTAKIG
jgi:hypothetical protein